MKTTRFLLALLLIVISFYACKRECECTEMYCLCQELTFAFEANSDNNVQGAYTFQELDAFYLHRTSLDYQLIDSLKMDFDTIYGNTDYDRKFEITSGNYTDFSSFKDYNFIIKNTQINYCDTISNIDYTQTMVTSVCNKCTNCDDETITCAKTENFTFLFNGLVKEDNRLKLEN
jgi:hypothetical protein